MKFEFTERQVKELVQAMQCHTCNLDEDLRNQRDPNNLDIIYPDRRLKKN
jgi:hypothetical protein